MARDGLIASIGPVMQIAFAPGDFDAALQYWTETMGVGPFFWIEHAGLENAMFNGEPSDVDFGLALSYWGDVQIELIRQHNDAPSIYVSAPWANPNAMHHVCVLTDDIKNARSTSEQSGARIVFSADVPVGGGVFYADTGGGLVEVLQPTPGGLEFFETMRAAAASWDGRDPLRPVG
jgi:hypothetical protein